jgi:hypothetical protein
MLIPLANATLHIMACGQERRQKWARGRKAGCAQFDPCQPGIDLPT